MDEDELEKLITAETLPSKEELRKEETRELATTLESLAGLLENEAQAYLGHEEWYNLELELLRDISEVLRDR